MDVKQIAAVVWEIVNSPAGVTSMVSLLIWALNKLYAKKPLWKEYEGTIISAIKLAEKEVPADHPNKGLQRLDTALRYVLNVYTQAKGRTPTPVEEAELREAIQVTHVELEAAEAI